MRTILVTGAAGFIGSNFVRMLVERNETVKLIALDKLTYAGNLANLQDLARRSDQLIFVRGDICDAELVVGSVRPTQDYANWFILPPRATSIGSILGSGPFVQTNVVGTQVLLDVAKAKGIEKFLYVSTDEVYGTLPEDQPEIKFTEETPLQPNSPYSASKAAGDCLVRAYFHTFRPAGADDALLTTIMARITFPKN